MGVGAEENPYRLPEARIASASLATDSGEDACWRHGAMLIVRRGQPLPPRCVKCNADAHDDMRERRFSRVSRKSYLPLLLVPLVLLAMSVVQSLWLLLGVPLGFLGALIANLRLRRHARHVLGLCAHHRRRRARMRWSALGLLLAGAAVAFVAEMPVLMVVAFGFAVALAWSAEQLPTTLGIDGHYSYFAECGGAFLDSLPELPPELRPAEPPGDRSR